MNNSVNNLYTELNILCVDPGTRVSGAVVFHPHEMCVSRIFPEAPNSQLLAYIEEAAPQLDMMLFEMVASYGMPVGRDVFETVRWAGNFEHAFGRDRTRAVYRRDVKLALCNTSRAKDAHVRQALIDRFPSTGGGKNPAVGIKARKGPLYGLTKHAVSALAVGVAWWELEADEFLSQGAPHKADDYEYTDAPSRLFLQNV